MDILEKYKDILINELIKFIQMKICQLFLLNFQEMLPMEIFQQMLLLFYQKKLKINPNEVYTNIKKIF